MTIETERLYVVPHLPRHLRALLRGIDEFENTAGLRVASGIRDQLLQASPQFFAAVETGKQPDPWRFGFAAIHKSDNVLIGTGGYPGPPDESGVAEISYGISPEYQGNGYATEVAHALIDFAGRDERVRRLRAHTLPETNASTRVLEKCGFLRLGDTTDPENGIAVWRWERPLTSDRR